MNEQEIALGALIAAQHACFLACKSLDEQLGFAVDQSRYKSFAGASLKEIKKAYELTEETCRLLQKAVDRMRRYEINNLE